MAIELSNKHRDQNSQTHHTHNTFTPPPLSSLLVCALQLLPTESQFSSPLTIRLLDERLFGWKPLVGVLSIPDVRKMHQSGPSGPRELATTTRGASSIYCLGTQTPQTYCT